MKKKKKKKIQIIHKLRELNITISQKTNCTGKKKLQNLLHASCDNYFPTVSSRKFFSF